MVGSIITQINELELKILSLTSGTVSSVLNSLFFSELYISIVQVLLQNSSHIMTIVGKGEDETPEKKILPVDNCLDDERFSCM